MWPDCGPGLERQDRAAAVHQVRHCPRLAGLVGDAGGNGERLSGDDVSDHDVDADGVKSLGAATSVLDADALL